MASKAEPAAYAVAEENALADYHARVGKWIMTKTVFCYPDDDSGELTELHFDPPIRVRVEKSHETWDVLNGDGRFVDPWWNVSFDMRLPPASIFGYRGFMVEGPSYDAETGLVTGDVFDLAVEDGGIGWSLWASPRQGGLAA